MGSSNTTERVPDIGCTECYQLHLLADGGRALCRNDKDRADISGNVQGITLSTLRR
jgi:hypothetical protein